MATHALDRHLVLVGFMGAGKSTLARKVARRLGREFRDTDDDLDPALILDDEAAFRAVEAVAVRAALAVVAEAAVAFELARAAREKFGGDALGDFVGARRAYLERIPWRPTR